MKNHVDRRTLLQTIFQSAAGVPLALAAGADFAWASGVMQRVHGNDAPGFEISLAELSFTRSLKAQKMDHLDFAKTAKTELAISAIEYASQFFQARVKDGKYLDEMNKRAAEHGVRQLLIAVDGEGRIGDADEKKRQQAVANHRQWIDAARSLGCHSIQVNPVSSSAEESDQSRTPAQQHAEQQKRVVESLAALCEYSGKHKINILLGNYGGLSSNAAWVVGVIKAVDHPLCGTLPVIDKLSSDQDYENLASLVPFAKGVTAKTWEFDPSGRERNSDFFRALKTVQAGGYRGYVGVHFAGKTPNEIEGIRVTKKLLETVRNAAAQN